MDIEKEVYKISSKVEEKKKKMLKPAISTVWRPRYIHEVFTQERLLRDAVSQEYLNKYSLVSCDNKTQMIQMQEAKKKAYSLNTGQNYIQDPIKYVSKLTATRRAVTEIRVPKESPTMNEDGFAAIHNFYRESDDDCDEPSDDALLPARPETERPGAVHIDFTEAEHYFKKTGRHGKQRPGDDKGLGKRSAVCKPLDEQGAPLKYKYCDPVTGAYYNTLEDFKKLRQLWAVDQKKLAEKSMHFLGVLNSTKSKRLSYLLTNNE